MDISIGTTIIAGIFVVSAPVVSYFVKRYFDGKDKTQVESTRRDALAGRWEGIMTLDCTDNNISGDISIKCEITEKDNTLEGKSVIAYRYLSQEITSKQERYLWKNRAKFRNFERNWCKKYKYTLYRVRPKQCQYNM